MESTYCVYILYSERLDRYYTGQTDSLSRRLSEHNGEDNGGSTRSGRPWVLYLSIACESRLHAVRIERRIKQMKSRVYLERLKADSVLLGDLRLSCLPC